MSIQIFQDSENIPGLGKKNKRGDENGMKTNIPKPTKRVALGNITNQVHGSRIQPSRAAKEKHKVCLRFSTISLFEAKSAKRIIRGLIIPMIQDEILNILKFFLL